MRVISENPVIFTNGHGGNFSNANGKLKAKIQKVSGKIKGAIAKGQALKSQIQQGTGNLNQTNNTPPVYIPEYPNAKPGMSTGAKVGIVIGVLALVGGIIYFVKKKGKK